MTAERTQTRLRVLSFEERRLLKLAVSNARLARERENDRTHLAERQCRYCGKDFIPRRLNQTCCTEMHKKLAWERDTSAGRAWRRTRLDRAFGKRAAA